NFYSFYVPLLNGLFHSTRATPNSNYIVLRLNTRLHFFILFTCIFCSFLCILSVVVYF
ncbi:hypothetical protein L9F63_007234, partial [Diploptera punctata]